MYNAQQAWVLFYFGFIRSYLTFMNNLTQKLALEPPAAPHRASSLTAATRPLICSRYPTFVPLNTPKRPPAPSYFRAPATRSPPNRVSRAGYQLFCATCWLVWRACSVADTFLLGDHLGQVISFHRIMLASTSHSTYTQQRARRYAVQGKLDKYKIYTNFRVCRLITV